MLDYLLGSKSYLWFKTICPDLRLSTVAESVTIAESALECLLNTD